MIHESSRNMTSGYLQAPMLPQSIQSEVYREPVDLLMDNNTGTLVWCEKVPSLREFLQATSNFQG